MGAAWLAHVVGSNASQPGSATLDSESLKTDRKVVVARPRPVIP